MAKPAIAAEDRMRVYRIQILDRMFEMLDVLKGSNAGFGVAELSRRLHLHKSTTHRLVMVLESRQFVERDAVSGKYLLGSRLMELGLSVLARTNVDEVARPHLRALVQETGETAHLGVLRDGEVVSVVNVESSQTLRTPATVGTRTPAYCTSLGKAMLAFSAPEAVDTFLEAHSLHAYTPNTITSASRLHEELRVIRRRGYAIDDEERENGLRCIAAPVWDHSGEVVAAAGIAGPVFRVTPKRIPALSAAVSLAADRISRSLGYAPQPGRGITREARMTK